MLILGPAIVSKLNPQTALLPSRGQAMLGPAVGGSGEVDPISRVFLLCGKLIALERVLGSQPGGDNLTQQLKGFVMGVVDTASRGRPDSFDEFTAIWEPGVEFMQWELERIKSDIERVRQSVMDVFSLEVPRLLGTDPTEDLAVKVERVVTYMQSKGLTVGPGTGGLREYLARAFRDHNNLPIAFPTAPNPTFPDGWITPDVVTPQGTIGAISFLI